MHVIDKLSSYVYNACRMRGSITIQAPAKINLGLKVYPKRSDGYHDIASIFTTTSLHDTIKVSLTERNNTCFVSCSSMVLPSDNTFTKAYKAFCVLTGMDRGVSVEVTKRIPSGGGLGGGSSDASSFIKSIDTLLDTQLRAEDMLSIAGAVGSDVFFFTKSLLERDAGLCGSDRFAAYVGGRGEIVEPIEARDDFGILLVFPGVSVSTKEAYSLVDESLNTGICSEETECEKSFLLREYSKPVREWAFQNDFATPVTELYPVIGDAMKALVLSGASFVDMSGSGSTVFGIYEDSFAAAQAKAKLEKCWHAVLA